MLASATVLGRVAPVPKAVPKERMAATNVDAPLRDEPVEPTPVELVVIDGDLVPALPRFEGR